LDGINFRISQDNMDEFKVVYTLSDSKSLILQAVNSVKSLIRFVDKSNIVFIINPYSKKLEKILGRFGEIYRGNDYYTRLNLPIYKYKIEMCDINAKNLIFLDCDTIIYKDITELLDGDFQFFGREEPCRSINGNFKNTWNEEIWKNNLRKFRKNENAIPYNDGFIIFKDGIHKKIKDEFILFYKMYNEGSLKSPNTVDNMHHNEFALSMAVANYKCKSMSENHHWYGWRNEMFKEKPYVLHLGTNKNGMFGYLNNLRKFI